MPQAKLYLVHEEAQNQSSNTMIFSSRIMSHAGTNYSSLWSVLRTKQKSLYVKISVRLSSIANRQIVSVVPCSSRSVRLRRSAIVNGVIVTAEWKSEGSLGRVGSFFFLPVPSLSWFFTPRLLSRRLLFRSMHVQFLIERLWELIICLFYEKTNSYHAEKD